MDTKSYLKFVGDRFEQAESSQNKEEWIRLATVLIDILESKIQELENPK